MPISCYSKQRLRHFQKHVHGLLVFHILNCYEFHLFRDSIIFESIKMPHCTKASEYGRWFITKISLLLAQKWTNLSHYFLLLFPPDFSLKKTVEQIFCCVLDLKMSEYFTEYCSKHRFYEYFHPSSTCYITQKVNHLLFLFIPQCLFRPFENLSKI